MNTYIFPKIKDTTKHIPEGNNTKQQQQEHVEN